MLQLNQHWCNHRHDQPNLLLYQVVKATFHLLILRQTVPCCVGDQAVSQALPQRPQPSKVLAENCDDGRAAVEASMGSRFHETPQVACLPSARHLVKL